MDHPPRPGGDPIAGAEEWRLLKAGAPDADFLEVEEAVDAFNRFARRASVLLNDPDGTKASEYPEFTPVDLEVKRDIDPGWTNRFNLFVANPERLDGQLRLHLHSHDQWLRGRPVFKTYTNQSKSTILQNLVESYTPLTWDAAKVTMVDNANLTREWRGEPLDAVIKEVASASGGEEFGAEKRTGDGAIVFFFRPRTTRTSPRAFPQGEYFGTPRWSQDARQKVNKATVYYGKSPNTGAVTVQDRSDQENLQGTLGLVRPVVVEVSRTYPEITTADQARIKAHQLLNERASILTGELQTWEAFDVIPGDVAAVVDATGGVNADFRVAELRYEPGVTTVKLAENREGVIDVLVQLSEEVGRIDARDADPTAVPVDYVEVDVNVIAETTVEVVKRILDQEAFILGDLTIGRGFGSAADGIGGKLGDHISSEVVLESG